MYDVWPVDCERVTLAVPAVQVRELVPPLLDVAIARLYEGDVNVKLPPVEPDNVMITLVAFTWRESAAEPAAMVSVVEGEVRKIAVAAV